MDPKGRRAPPMGLLRRLDAGARAAFPAFFTGFLIILAAVPVGAPGLIQAVALPGIFFWTIFRPAAMPAPVVFLLGLLEDLLSFAPLGSGVLTLLIVHGIALRGRDIMVRQSFLSMWLIFCAMAAGAAALGWALEAVLGWHIPPTAPGLLEFGIAVGLYPAIAWVLTRLHTAMRRAEAAL
ncbi:rod shape-determining protein MreD [Roseococcus sp. YIM B11640]|uniref:rod shape-determining protein MreD n=1 Tax=Roseococcus sp. YIM B11640 TaxID=3133973 RepID=UPI003C7B1F9D